MAAVPEIGDVAAAIDDDLRAQGTPAPDIRAVTRRHSSGLTRCRSLELVEALWREPVHERRMAAVEVLVLRRKDLELADAPLLERLIGQSRTWALVDNLAGTCRVRP
jgi:3-methyladenine DNA glycosylase AlkD